MRWIWVRHGETADNRERRYLGHYDAPLTDRGKKQAKAAARRLEKETIHYVYTSDLERCRETAAIIASPHRLAVMEVPELRELNFGRWDRKTYEEIMQTDKQLAEKWYNNPYETAPPGGESLAELGNRVSRWLFALEKQMHPDETAVLVTHGGPIRWFLTGHVTGKPSAFWSVRGPGTGEIFIVDKHGQTWSSPSL
ncbi:MULTISPECIES: histidine phosphatase family protein [Aneurinibacillus]|jgi:alpha-ribazole phosphatase|uniref:Alpha-ribazole phosphatase n=1 Tax=Aneurinibacillus danicus TaxID=267746 RepID=A0A511V6R9_9BACL|nr:MULTISPECIES: histidine phosphatase family protein [Aneurinibacillus]GEN33403.1 alpha-ribazole phosphatase [Aneurinibacillus danicus]